MNNLNVILLIAYLINLPILFSAEVNKINSRPVVVGTNVIHDIIVSDNRGAFEDLFNENNQILLDLSYFTFPNYGRVRCYPLHVAVFTKNLLFIELLLKKGADVNAIDESGKPMLFHAIQTGNLNIIKLLVEYKIKIDVNDNEGKNFVGFCEHLINIIIFDKDFDKDRDKLKVNEINEIKSYLEEVQKYRIECVKQAQLHLDLYVPSMPNELKKLVCDFLF